MAKKAEGSKIFSKSALGLKLLIKKIEIATCQTARYFC